MGKNLIIIGAGGHGKVIADIAALNGYEKVAFLDDITTAQVCLGYPVIGKLPDAHRYPDADFIVGIGNAKARESIQKCLCDRSLHIATLIHPKTVVARDVQIGKGTVVMAGVVINPGSVIGDGCIINTHSTVEHDARIADYVHISPGSQLAGTVSVGKSTWVGIGSVVSDHIRICGDCMIGAGAVVVRNIEVPGTYVGVPAKRMQKNIEKFENPCGGGGVPSKLLPIVAEESEAA